MNNKGMAISGILYSLLILFIILVLSILSLMATSRHAINKLKDKVIDDLNSPITAKILITANITTPTEDSVFVTALFKPALRKQPDWIYEYSIDNGKTWIEVEDDTCIHEFIENWIIKARIKSDKFIIAENSYKVTNIVEPILVAGKTGGTSSTERYLTTDTSQTLLREDIETVAIVNHKNIPTDGSVLGSYDVSEAKNGSVMLWYTLGSTTECGGAGKSQCYKVYIGGKGKVFANKDSGNMFDLNRVTSIDAKYLDTSKVTSMARMFYDAVLLTTIELGPDFVTDNVTTMMNMFSESSRLTTIITADGINKINWDTSKVTDMTRMFYNNKLDTIEFGSKFVTNNVKNMSEMFRIMKNLTTITTPYGINKINWDTSKVTDMSFVFYSTQLSTIEFGPNFVTSNVTNIRAIFSEMTNLTTITTPYGTNKINWDTSKVTDMVGMFSTTKLSTIEFGPNFVTNSVTNIAALFESMANLTTITTPYGTNKINWDTSKVTSISQMFRDTKLSSIEFGSNFVTNNVTDMKFLFYNMTNLTTITTPYGINKINWDTSKVTNMMYMFYGTQLSTIEFGPNFVTSNVTDMQYMLSHMANLTTITTPYGTNKINWDTSKVTTMYSTFSNVKLTSLEFGESVNTSSVTTMSFMFASNDSLITIEFGSNFVTNNVKDMSGIFSGLTSLTTITTPYGTNKINWDTSKVTDMGAMFTGTKLSSLEFGSSFTTSSVTTMSSMFRDMTNLNSVSGLDIRYFNFTKVKDYTNMLGGTTPKTAKITVNQAGRDWLSTKFSTYTYTVIP